MKRRLMLAGMVLVLVAAGESRAALRTCRVDPDACPVGEHLHCVTYGWCGNQCEDSCDGEPRIPDVCVPSPENGMCGQW